MKGSIQHLNYCRQALASWEKQGPSFVTDIYKDISENKVARDFYAKMVADIASVLRGGAKIQLPEHGRILDDRTFKNLSSLEEINLPFPKMALEFSKPRVHDLPGEMSYSKRIVIVTDGDDRVYLSEVSYADSMKSWAAWPYVWMPKKNFIDFTNPNKPRFFIGSNNDVKISDYEDGGFALLDLLNALACKNVRLERSTAKSNQQGKKVKTALPFDDYHFLTVDCPGKASARGEGFGGSHRSPREHLRRGHIRRLESGAIWVNACVVNAGIGNSVHKSYIMRKAS
jgi:hypothetical protein